MSRMVAPIRYFPSCPENLLCERKDKKCTKQRAEGYRYCAMHCGDPKLQKCNYMSCKTNRRCPNVINKSDRDGFCLEHARLVTEVRRAAAHRGRHRDSAETVFESITQYISFATDQDNMPRDSLPSTSGGSSLDWFSESSDEDEMSEPLTDAPLITPHDNILTVHDPLVNAGIYTTEEIALQTRDKFIRLQNLYLESFKIVEQKIRNKAAFYKPKVAEELKKYGRVKFDPSDSYSEQKKVRKFLALKKHHKERGKMALLKLASDTKRKGIQNKINTCEQCSEASLPCAKLCVDHIIDDPRQVLFSKCEESKCRRVVYQHAHFPFCHMHAPPPCVNIQTNVDELCDSAGQLHDHNVHVLVETGDEPEEAHAMTHEHNYG